MGRDSSPEPAHANTTYSAHFSFCFRDEQIISATAKSAMGSMFSKDKSAKQAQLDKIAEIKKSHPKNIMTYCFDNGYFNGLSAEEQKRLLQCCNSGIENADSSMGCYAMQPSDYDDFKKFFQPVLERYHNVDLAKKGHENNWNLEGVEGLPEDGKLDVSAFGLGALSMRIRTARNLKKFPLPGAMTKEDRVEMEKAMGAVFEALIAKPEFGGEYVSLTPGHPNQMSEERC